MEKTIMDSKEDVTKNKVSTKKIVYVGMFAAILAILAQIAIPTFSGVPITLQTFAVALTGAILGWKLGLTSTAIYILIGAAGAPVFANMRGGFQVLTVHTGGFIWGFLFMVLLCGIGSIMKNKILGIMIGLVGLMLCHTLGVLQFSYVMSMDLWKTVTLVSLPYLIKDIASVVLAFIVGGEIRKRLMKANLM